MLHNADSEANFLLTALVAGITVNRVYTSDKLHLIAGERPLKYVHNP